MRHRKRTVKLSRTSSHKKAMLRNMVCSLIDHGKIKTTKAKAKAARSLADKIIHLAVTGNDTATRRRAFQLLGNKETVKHLFNEVAEKFSKNNGGYTKIIAYGNQKGDNAEMVFFMLSYDVAEKSKTGSTMKYHFKKKKEGKKEPSKPKQENTPEAGAESLTDKAEQAEDKPEEKAPDQDKEAEESSEDQEQDGSSDKKDEEPSEQSDENK